MHFGVLNYILEELTHWEWEAIVYTVVYYIGVAADFAAIVPIILSASLQ